MKKILVLLTALTLMLSLMCTGAWAEATATEAPAAEAPATEATAAEATADVAASEAPAAEETAAEEETEAEEPYTGIVSASSLITIGVLLVLMVAALMLSAKRVKWDAAMIAKAAMCVALAYVLSMIKLFRMPQGGSVTLVSMLPLILFAMAFGPLESLLVGCVYGLLQLLIDPYVIHPIQLLVDYPLAFGAVALACVAKIIPVKEYWKLPLAALLGYLGRYIMAVLSGVVFFAEYAGEQNALIYSLVYNISYLGIEAVICVAVTLIPGMSRLPSILRKNAYK